MRGIYEWELLFTLCAAAFQTTPSFSLFREYASAWILCVGRHTTTRILQMTDPSARRSHDAYHRFLRAGAWSMTVLWRSLAEILVQSLVEGASVLDLDLDDTLFHKSGRKVEGSGIYRDAVRSTAARVVYALGLNLVVLTLRVRAPWGGEPLGLPINARLYRKKGPSRLDLAEEMIQEVASWFPGLRFHLCADGAYASLAGRDLPRTHVTSRMRRDAALYEIPRKVEKKSRGRPRKKGSRLPAPKVLVREGTLQWKTCEIDVRGRPEKRLIHSRLVLWHEVCGTRPVLLVIVRDPEGKEKDDFFFTTDVETSGAEVASRYLGRWSIEDTFRNVKQYLKGEDPQTWKGEGPERAACLSLWLYSAVWSWYIAIHGAKPRWIQRPWYKAKSAPSFINALAALRRALWLYRFFARFGCGSNMRKMGKVMIEALAEAA